MQYRPCPDCGANLDFGENCDCQDIKQKQLRYYESALYVGEGGQMEIGGLHSGKAFNERGRDRKHALRS